MWISGLRMGRIGSWTAKNFTQNFPLQSQAHPTSSSGSRILEPHWTEAIERKHFWALGNGRTSANEIMAPSRTAWHSMATTGLHRSPWAHAKPWNPRCNAHCLPIAARSIFQLFSNPHYLFWSSLRHQEKSPLPSRSNRCTREEMTWPGTGPLRWGNVILSI